MDNKLGELSKPVATVDVQRGRMDGNMFGVAWSSAGHALPDGPHFLYSQEYVSALLAELEAKDKRIAELEAIRADAAQVFKEIGNEMGCNPDNESIMMAIDALKERLATPVRLLGEMLPHEWERAERQATFQHRKIAWDARLAEDKKAILAAGFTFTVEGG